MSDTLFLVDAYAQIYRGFYAVRDLTNSRGEPSNAVFAMSKFLIKLHKEHPGACGAFVFDVGKPSFRMELAPDYKANRQPMPEELRAQIPALKELIHAFGWPEISREGYEADDLLAALAVDFPDRQVRIISSDKDIHQVITDNIRMLVPDRKGGFEERGPAEVVEKFQVSAAQIVDYLALIGDTSDNIPGVPGVGPKTAAKLICDMHSIDNMLAHPEKIENVKLREKICAARDVLIKNQKLVKLKTDVDDKPWADKSLLERSNPDWEAIVAIAERFDLRSVVKEINELSGGGNNDACAMDDDLFSAAPAKEQPDLFGGL